MLILSSLQDRVIFHRLEHICTVVETGEWPIARPSNYINKDALSDSRSGTPVPGTPSECDTPLHSYDYGSSGTPDAMVSYDSQFGYEVGGDGIVVCAQMWLPKAFALLGFYFNSYNYTKKLSSHFFLVCY